VSRIEVQSPQDNVQKGQRLTIIELERYNEIRELLIENRTTGSQGHVCYWHGGQKGSVTMAAGGEGGRDVNRSQGHIQSASELGMRTGMHLTTADQSEKH